MVSVTFCPVLSCPVLSCPVQYRRPNDWADRAENLHKQSFELCDEDRGVGDPECALMRAQTCAQHHISNGQWAVVMGVGGRECALMCALREQTCA
jgi:hypothetical protein